MEKYVFGWEPTEQELEWCRNMSIRTKERLLQRAKEQRERVQEQSKTDQKHSSAYYAVYDSLFEKLIAGIEGLVLFDNLEDCWAYTFYINSEGASVILEHISYATFTENGENTSFLTNTEFEILKIPCRMLTVEEYARVYNVEQGTVRQWIRRGKVRTAKKYGNEWRISEFTETPQRGYTSVTYEWDEDLKEIPEDYDFLSNKGSLDIVQDERDPKIYHVIVTHGKNFGKDRSISAKEREKLEPYLISNPLIRYVPSDYSTWC